MAESRVVLFTKFFEKEEYADEFVKGRLFLNRLSYFKRIEASEESNDGRPDANEAVAMWWQPDELEITMDIQNIGTIKIVKDDLASPVSTSFDYHNHLHIFCISSIQMEDPSSYCDIEPVELAANLKAQMQFDERCLRFGPYAVVVQAVPFLTQLKKALHDRGQWSKAEKVEYYDETAFHGEFHPHDIPFRKQMRFAYQREYRVCVQTGTKGDDAISIDLGDISAFSAKMRSADVNDAYEINVQRQAKTDGVDHNPS